MKRLEFTYGKLRTCNNYKFVLLVQKLSREQALSEASVKDVHSIWMEEKVGRL